MRSVIAMSFVVSLLSVMACKSKAPAASGADPAASSSGSKETASQRVSVKVDEHGYTPSTISAKAGERLTLLFKRVTDRGCGEVLVFPAHGIRRDLPLDQEVEVELTPKANERIAFTCGMGMYRGSIVASR